MDLFENLTWAGKDWSGDNPKGLLDLSDRTIVVWDKSKNKISSEEVAKLTLECLTNSVPSEVPGIAFLSGGQSEIEATENLNLINKYNKTNL